eukprot:jgi/Psemu1/24294/gm1.24294_g
MTTAEADAEGSWIPLLCVVVLLLLWWTSYSQSTRAVRTRRWYNTKKLGLRDESIYRDGAAGDGANQRHKRQG